MPEVDAFPKDYALRVLNPDYDDSDVIQAIKQTSHIFMIGVQWRPGYLPAMRDQQRIFRELVNSARDIKAKSASRSGRRQ